MQLRSCGVTTTVLGDQVAMGELTPGQPHAWHTPYSCLHLSSPSLAFLVLCFGPHPAVLGSLLARCLGEKDAEPSTEFGVPHTDVLGPEPSWALPSAALLTQPRGPPEPAGLSVKG